MNPLITLKIINKSGQVMDKVASRKSKRVFSFIQRANIKDCVFSVCVNYGGGFKNEGDYDSKSYLIFALKAFLEKD
jgi:hypothetical protein